MRIVILVLFIAAGLYALMIWAVGSHGHMSFRTHMTEDWVFLTFIILGSISLIILILKLLKRLFK